MKLGPFKWWECAPTPVIGVDEAGRGCLAGPVVAAAVILRDHRQKARFFDSKALSESRREKLLEVIQTDCHWAVGLATPAEIDELNILQASLLAMHRAVQGLKLESATGHVLVDGPFAIPDLHGFTQTPLVKGDTRAEPISAASIVAKVTRDRIMLELSERHPGYGFEIHKGYPTELHRSKLVELGPAVVHRLSFRGVVTNETGPLGSQAAQHQN